LNQSRPLAPDEASDPNERAFGMSQAQGKSSGAALEQLVDRLFLRALQFVLGGVWFGVAFFPLRGRGSALDFVVAGGLLALAIGALVFRRVLLERLRAHPAATLLFPLPPLAAIAVDGGFDSVWTPLVAITVGVPATLGLPWLSLGCALLTATGQAGAAWINRGNISSEQLIETTIFSGAGTVAVGVGISLSVATLGDFLHRRPQVLMQLRESGLALDPATRPSTALTAQRQLLPAARIPLSPAELRVVTLLAGGRAPKQVAADLKIAVPTVRSHLKAAKRKTHARTLSELVGLFITEDGQL